MNRSNAFTLAELLIALTLLGVIATFTIPKVLNAQRSSQYNAIAKETAGMLAGALQIYQYQGGGVASGTTMGNITSYMNYVAVDTARTVDDITGQSPVICGSGGARCLVLHNGAVFWYWNYVSFAGTSTTNAIFYHLDPDGIASGTKAINFFIYANGAVRDEGTIYSNTVSSDLTRNPNSANNPSWWSNWQ